MTWRAPTESDLLDRISAEELQSLRMASLAQGQGDPIATTLQTVVDEVRGYIAANRENVLGPLGTLPPRLIGPAMDLLLLKIGSRLVGIVFDPDNIRRDAAREARRLLERVSDGRYQVEHPGTPADASQQGSAPRPSFADTRPSNFHPSHQDGI
jgi:hypothetical protein